MSRRKKLDLSRREDRLTAMYGDLQQLRDAWEELGRPELSRGYRGATVEHPLVRMIRQAERNILDIEKRVGHRAPPQPTNAPPRRAKLKVVS